jgi:hypothetical protein
MDWALIPMKQRLRSDPRRAILVAALASMIATAPANACRIHVPLDLEHVRMADIVVVGRISNYRIERDEETRRQALKSPNLAAEQRRFYEGRGRLWTDSAMFEVEVDEVLFGKAPKKLLLSWNHSTYPEPETMPAGPYLIAIMRPRPASRPPQGPVGLDPPGHQPVPFIVLEQPCSAGFIFETGSEEARTLRRMLSTGPR